MRTDLDVYDQLLELQAEASFGLEQRLFAFEGFERAERVVDLGCGNASFARRLASRFPGKDFAGIDPNGALLARGRARTIPPNLELVEGDIHALPADATADVLLVRLVMMYIRDPRALARAASERSPTAIVVDFADDLFEVTPAVPLFEQALTAAAVRRRRLGERRDVQAETVGLWEGAGYGLAEEEDVVVSSDRPLVKPLMHLLMVLNAEMAVGSPLPPPLVEELHDWAFDDDSYLQYGLRARRFERARR